MTGTHNYNIILVNLDGLRKDKINLCPYLKSFRDENTYFSKMISVAPYTLAAHHAIFSGLYPSQNGVNAYYNMFRFKKDEITTFPELLSNAGYHTRCDVISESIIPKQGFDKITIFDEKTVDFKSHHSKIIKEVSSYEKFFLFLHYEGVHSRLVEDISKKYEAKSNDDEYFEKIDENEKRYNSYLASCDKYVKEIIKSVEELSNSDKTILIFFADHGTSLGEKKGERLYGVYAYDYTVNSFCIIKGPSLKPKKSEKQCSILDIFPTILKMVKVDEMPKNEIEGKNLLTDSKEEEREVFIETGGLYGYWPSPKKHNVFCIRYDDKKLIYNDTPKTWEFYNLKNDPNELSNIFDENSNQVKQFNDMLYYYLRKMKIHTKITPMID